MPRLLVAVTMVSLVVMGIFFISCAPQQTQQRTTEQVQQQQGTIDTAQVKMYLSLGWENYKNKQYDRAIEQFKKVLELDPQNEKAYKFLADACLRHPDTTFIDTALAHYSEAIKKFPNNAYFYAGVGYIYQKMAATIGASIDSVADSSGSAQLMTQSHAFEDKALDNFRKACELNNKDASSSNSVGTIMLRRGKLDSAMVWFEKSAEADSNQTGTWEVLAKIYVTRNSNEKAAKAYSHLSRLEPDEPEHLLRMGQYIAKMGELQSAIDILQKYIEKNTSDYRGYQYLGLALAAVSQFKEALEQFKEAEKLNSSSVKLMCDIASTYRDMKRYDNAENYIGKAKRIDSNYGYIYIVEGDIVRERAEDMIPPDHTLNMEVKCQFLIAKKIYQKALRDPDWAGIAQSKLDYLEPYIPTKEEIAAYKFIEGKSCGD